MIEIIAWCVAALWLLLLIFVIYLVVKSIGFIINATRLYRQMVERLDTIIKSVDGLPAAIQRKADQADIQARHNHNAAAMKPAISAAFSISTTPRDDDLRPITFCRNCHQKMRVNPDTDHINPICQNCEAII